MSIQPLEGCGRVDGGEHMRAVRVTGPGVVEVADIEPPSGDGVRVRVIACGICGSDLHLAGFGPLQCTLGHEFAGLLDDGSPVVVEPHVPCGTCDICTTGPAHLCRTIMQRMYGISLDGGLAEEVIVDPASVLPLPATVPVESAALVEPVAVAVHGINKLNLRPGQRVLVIGGGSIGLTAVAVLRHRDIEVDLVARHPAQRESGEALGAGTAIADEYDVVVDAAGTQSSTDAAFGKARPGGAVLALGSYWEPIQLTTGSQLREVTLIPALTYGHHNGRREFIDAIDVLAASPSIVDALVTHRFALDDAAEAFRVAGDRQAGAIKVVISP
jgi:threonine dehydrogenase-like Zn-dependent dehydrogenase